MSVGYFIAGTDTGVGKTSISALLIRHFVAAGWSTLGMKPVAAGCVWQDGALCSDDVQELLAASNVTVARELVNPYALLPPIAPHIAAAQAGCVIDLDVIIEAHAQLQQQAEVVIVEGVGGFCVPLNAVEDTADLAQRLALPVILVVGMRLGCLSHALLTVEAVAARGLVLAGWVANQIDPQMLEFEANVDALKQRIPAPCIAVVPHFNALSALQETQADHDLFAGFVSQHRQHRG